MTAPQTYPSLFELTPTGLDLFVRIMQGQAPDGALDTMDRSLATPMTGTDRFEVEAFATARDLAAAVCGAFGRLSPHEAADRTGVWAWLTYVLRDCVFVTKGGVRKVGEIHRWYPSAPGDYQKAQRHLIRMPVLLYASLGKDADLLLCGRPSVHGELREQLTAQQDMISRNFQQVARQLYYVEAEGSFKRGAGGSLGGSARRLRTIRKQLDVTWDMSDMAPASILKLLPAEFDPFRT